MRIVHLLYDDMDNPWLGGGGARRAHEVNRRLCARHQITVISGGYAHAPAALEREGVGYRFTPASSSYAASRLNYLRHAAGIARRLHPDLIVEDFSAYNPLFSPLWARQPVVGLVQNLFGRHSAVKFGLPGKLVGLLERPALRRFRHIVVPSRGLGRQLQRSVNLRHRHAAVIPNGIAACFFAPTAAASDRPPFVLFSGRVDIYQKGLDTLLAALHRARQEQPDISLLLVAGGTPEREGMLRDLIAGYGLDHTVQWIERIGQAELASLLHDPACRFVITPSRYESWGMTAAEAAAAGKPVLGFAIHGLDEAAAANGLLLPNSDDEEQRVLRLADGIVQLWCDADLRARLGAAGKGWATKYTWERVADAQERFYLEAVGGLA